MRVWPRGRTICVGCVPHHCSPAMSMHISKLFGVEGKNVLVTGGGRGIGRYIAEAFVSNGANVFIASRNRDTCESTAETLSQAGPGRCTPVPMDLGSEDGCKTLASEVGYHVDHLNVLVNNAGVTWGQPFEQYPEKGACCLRCVRGPARRWRAPAPRLIPAAAAQPGTAASTSTSSPCSRSPAPASRSWTRPPPRATPRA